MELCFSQIFFQFSKKSSRITSSLVRCNKQIDYRAHVKSNDLAMHNQYVIQEMVDLHTHWAKYRHDNQINSGLRIYLKQS